jgi:hypothetical protein
MVVTTILFTHTTFLWATCCLICFIIIVKPFLTLILTTVHIVYLIWKKGSWRVWSIDRGCLLLHGTWSHLWHIQRSVYAHSLICISYWTYEIEYCSLFLTFHVSNLHRSFVFMHILLGNMLICIWFYVMNNFHRYRYIHRQIKIQQKKYLSAKRSSLKPFNFKTNQ